MTTSIDAHIAFGAFEVHGSTAARWCELGVEKFAHLTPDPLSCLPLLAVSLGVAR